MVPAYTIAQFTTFAQEYNCDAYGAGAYGVCETTSSSSSSSSSSLVNTGITVAVFVGLAVLILFVALLVRFWTKGKKSAQSKKSSSSTTPSNDDQTKRPPQPPIVGG